MFNRYFFGRFYSSNLMVNINPVGQSVQSEIGSVAPMDGYHDGAILPPEQLLWPLRLDKASRAAFPTASPIGETKDFYSSERTLSKEGYRQT